MDMGGEPSGVTRRRRTAENGRPERKRPLSGGTVSHRIAMNTRALLQPFLGVQRYMTEMLARMSDQVDTICPKRKLGMLRGYFWEQFQLPRQLHGRLLWSPSQAGPLSVANQVVTIHDMLHFDCPEGFTFWTVMHSRLTIPRLARRVRKVICDSEFTRRRLIEIARIPPEKAVVVHLGVDNRFQPQPPEEIARMRRALGLPSEAYILSLSALEPRKNLPRLLRAWGEAQKELPENLWLVLAGEAGEKQIFRRVDFPEIPPRVHFTGRVPEAELPALYAGALSFVYVSLYEGFGLPPLEAMACGTPVLVSNTTALPEVVGSDGIMIDPQNQEQIAASLVRFCGDTAGRKELSERGQKRAETVTWSLAVEKTLAVLLT